MQKRIARSLKGAQDTITAFSGPQKVIALIGVALLVLGGFAFMQWASKPTMVPLFTNVASQDAAAITQQLDSKGIQYSLADGGATINVPRADVYKARMDLSAQGLPAASSQKGWGIFDNQPINTTKFQQEVSYQRALEGELSKSITTIDGVQAAVVNLAIPQKSVFKEETDNPTASVVVSTLPGKSLQPGQVQSIVQLVSNGIVGMESDSVTVLDQNGNLLTDSGGAGVSDQREAEFTSATTRQIQAILDRIAGPGNAIATVSAELASAKREITKTEYESNEDVKPLTTKSRVEDFKGDGSAAAGVLGNQVQNNGQVQGQDNVSVPGGVGGGKSEMKVEDSHVQNAVDKKITHEISNGGEIKNMSVAVVVNQPVAEKLDLEALKNTVAAAVNINAERGDVVSVVPMPFDEAAAEQAAKLLEENKKAQEMSQIMSLAKTGAIALAIIILAIVTLIMSKRKRNQDEEYEEDEPTVAVEAPEPQAAIEPEPFDRSTLPEVEGPDPAYEAMKDDITELVEKQPDEVAELLRGWLADRRS